MITKHDLEAAIAECQGRRNPDARTCMMLAAFYTIRREMYGEEKEAVPAYSFAPAPMLNTVELDSGTDFARAVDGREQNEVLPIIDELMGTLQILYPRLYNAVMVKLS